MGSIDLANQLRKNFTIHFKRNEKEFFPGLFWSIDMVITNCYKIYQNLNIVDPKPTDHRRFTEYLVNLLFLQQSKGSTDTIIQPYPKYKRI